MDFLMHHMLRRSAEDYPAKEALVHGEQRLSYQEVYRKVLELAGGLRSIGVQRVDRVGIYLEPSIAQVLSIFSISQAGGAFVPINHSLYPDQVSHIGNDCRMKGLITTQSRFAEIKQVLEQIPSLEFVVLLDKEKEQDSRLNLHHFEVLGSSSFQSPIRETGIDKDLAALLYTSGSTGKPKGVMLSHANLIAGASIVSAYLGITAKERILAILPFSFDAGLNQLMTAFQQCATLVLMNFVFAREIVQMVLKEEITGLAGVPTLWSLIAQPSSTLEKNNFPHLRYITNTGGAMPQKVLAILRKALSSTKVFLMYGLTEAFRSTYLPPEELDCRPTSMGKAIPNCEILVVDENGELCKPGEIGELVHRGPTVSLGYWGNPELTNRVLRPNPFLPPELGDCERVCYSGDLVKMDQDGYLYFVGRRDTMIKSSGFRISPTEVEEVIFQSGKVQAAAVIGIPDEMLGQHIKAFVVPRDGEPLSPESLIEFCSEKLPRHMIPKQVEILVQIPKTSSGKVDYPALRRREGV
jgi:acyl-CoA ligase (AMP-forming) (exosortase A-associated)